MIKKIIFPATTIATFSYFSVFFGIGVVLGYLITKIFHDRFVETKKVNLIFIRFKKWEIHLHHWIMGALVLAVIAIGGWFFVLPKICIGSVMGVALHDLHFDRKWYKVISKRAHSSVG